MRFFSLIVAAFVTVASFQNCGGEHAAEFGSTPDVVEVEQSISEEEESGEVDSAEFEEVDAFAAKAKVTKPSCRVLKTAYVAKLEKVYQFEGVRVFYSVDRKNPDAVANLTDRNKNKFPDYVEDIARQIVYARVALNNLGFVDPLLSSRYRTYGVQFIDVHVRKLDGNGLAYDEAVVYSNNALKKNACTLQIDLSNQLDGFPGNWSVAAHELFHLYEYSYTMFKRSWFLEGMAAWGERVVKSGALRSNGLALLPQNSKQMDEQVFAVPYNYLWDRMAYLSESNKQINFSLSSSLQKATYVDGTKVFQDQKLLGIAMMKVVLKHLAQESAAISNEKGWTTYSWDEDEQKSAAHDKRMIKAVQRALKEMKLNNAEVAAFSKL